jgi:UDP-2,3-diacylglucosamine hydrolase
MHGDTLCTDDHAYQTFRAQTRAPAWRQQFLSQPLAARLAFAVQARAASRQRQQAMKQGDRAQFESVTDVSPAAVRDTFARYGIDTMIHGHTHRPAIHALDVDMRTCERVVLGDWYTQGSALRVDADGMQLSAIPL